MPNLTSPVDPEHRKTFRNFTSAFGWTSGPKRAQKGEKGRVEMAGNGSLFIDFRIWTALVEHGSWWINTGRARRIFRGSSFSATDLTEHGPCRFDHGSWWNLPEALQLSPSCRTYPFNRLSWTRVVLNIDHGPCSILQNLVENCFGHNFQTVTPIEVIQEPLESYFQGLLIEIEIDLIWSLQV